MEHSAVAVNPWSILPFVLLLSAIAVMPFVNRSWWHGNYPFVSLLLGSITVGYYLVALEGGVDRTLATAHEYISFISLIGSLYVVSGGIHIQIKGRATPSENLALLAVGAIIANVVGTTGASMLLIRPYLKNNSYRLAPYHVVFFVFIVANIGGALTPIGDPPLFLGFMKGIPFFWITEHTFLPWLVALSAILGVFYLIDLRAFRKIPLALRQDVITEQDSTRVTGGANILLLVVVIAAVFIEHPMFLREAVMLTAAVMSYFLTNSEIHRRNQFTFEPIREVAWLFIGIFLTMMPALDWLGTNASQIGISSPSGFYWGTGALSGVLDNAPTYLNFLAAAMGIAGKSVENVNHVREYIFSNSLHVAAISVAAVFFGAMTYIGNGPNFMVKSIAEQAGVRMPGFFGFIGRYSLPFLLPVFIIVWYLFFS